MPGGNGDGALRLGTRQSKLALAQSGMIARELERRMGSDARVDLVLIVTSGDIYRGDLSTVGGKGLFTLELENGLADGSIDLAVHSLKDLPVELPEGLIVAAYPERADPRDTLISEDGHDLDSLPEGAVVLTGSLRRRSQVLARRPDLEVRPIRGNVDTRIAKWRRLGVPGAVILAQAGLERLAGVEGAPRLADLPHHPLPPEQMLPAPGQGILAVETRVGGRGEASSRLLADAAATRAALAERSIVAAFGGDCTLPLAAWAREEGEELVVSALLATPDGRSTARGEGRGGDGTEAADRCIAALRNDGAAEILERIAALQPGEA